MSLLYPPNPWYEWCVKAGHTFTGVCVPDSFWTVVRGLLHSMTTRDVRPDLWFFVLNPEDCRCDNKYSTNFFSKDPECWSGWGLNLRPFAQQTGALPTEQTRQLLNISSNNYEALVLAHATLPIRFKQVLPHNFPIFFHTSHPFRTPT